MTKVTRFKVITTGTWNGNPYRYEESVPAREYQYSGWWLKFMSREKRDAIEALNAASPGDTFTRKSEDSVTEIIAE